MSYVLPEKLKDIPKYDPVTEVYRVRLDANESFIELPEDVKQDVMKAIGEVEFNRYPDPEARKLCEKFGAFFHVKPQLLTAGNGSDELISIIVPNFLGEGDVMLTILPDFSMYTFYTSMVGAKVEVLDKDDSMELDARDVIERARACKARLLIFSNPCNPTALKLEREDILEIVKNVDALVVVDEAYMDFSEGSVLDEIEQYENLIVLKTCSKAFGMAAIRLGFAAANERLTGLLHTLKSPYNVNSMTQAAGCAILEHEDFLRECISRIRQSTQALYQGMQELAGRKKDLERLYPTATNFLYIKCARAQQILQDLRKEGISVRCMNGYLRIAAGSPKENEELLQALERIME